MITVPKDHMGLDQAPLLLLTDANTALGQPDGAHVGDARLEPETEAGEALHTLLARLDLVAVNTFSRIHSGQHDTFANTQGASSRIDFVCIQRSIAQGVHGSSLEHLARRPCEQSL